jgi:hypothetical protein
MRHALCFGQNSTCTFARNTKRLTRNLHHYDTQSTLGIVFLLDTGLAVAGVDDRFAAH